MLSYDDFLVSMVHEVWKRPKEVYGWKELAYVYAKALMQKRREKLPSVQSWVVVTDEDEVDGTSDAVVFAAKRHKEVKERCLLLDHECVMLDGDVFNEYVDRLKESLRVLGEVDRLHKIDE